MDKKGYIICTVIVFVIAVIVASTLKITLNRNIPDEDTTSPSSTRKTTNKREDLMEGITLNYHASIRIQKNGKVIYFDPYKIDNANNDADYIFFTHSHYDHFSKEDINKIKKDTTKYVITTDLEGEIKNMGVSDDNILVVYPDKEYDIDSLSFETVPAYNVEKTYHKKSYNWVGYNITIDNSKYYIVGDSDATPELKEVKCDVIFIPVGGTYTMNSKEAAEVVNEMGVKYAVPIHYGVVGSRQDAEDFVGYLNDNIKGVVLK